jgi:hypothetical protein
MPNLQSIENQFIGKVDRAGLFENDTPGVRRRSRARGAASRV